MGKITLQYYNPACVCVCGREKEEREREVVYIYIWMWTRLEMRSVCWGLVLKCAGCGGEWGGVTLLT